MSKTQGNDEGKARIIAIATQRTRNATREGRRNCDRVLRKNLVIMNKLKVHGENIEESMVVENVLRSMTMKFNYVVCAIEGANDVTQMSIDGLLSSLIVHEQRMNGPNEEEQVLRATNVGSFRGRDEP